MADQQRSSANQNQQNQQRTSWENGNQTQRTTWDNLSSPGAYVEEGTGDLFRVPAEGLMAGASPVIEYISNSNKSLIRVSEDPYAPILKCRAMAADANVAPNF